VTPCRCVDISPGLELFVFHKTGSRVLCINWISAFCFPQD
jgi:hypothetical protein